MTQQGESDWEDQDLLFHRDAADRLIAEIDIVRQELAEIDSTEGPLRKRLQIRLAAMISRLAEAEDAIRAVAD